MDLAGGKGKTTAAEGGFCTAQSALFSSAVRCTAVSKLATSSEARSRRSTLVLTKDRTGPMNQIKAAVSAYPDGIPLQQ